MKYVVFIMLHVFSKELCVTSSYTCFAGAAASIMTWLV